MSRNYAGRSADRKRYGCDDKVNYGSWQNAERVARRARQKGRAAGHIMAPYHCHSCGGTHLTTVDPLQRKVDRMNKRRAE